MDDDMDNDLDMEFDEDFINEMAEIDERLMKQVIPIVDEIEEEHTEHSAWFILFVNTLHELFAQGWTKEELLVEIEDNHRVFVEQSETVPEGHQLH